MPILIRKNGNVWQRTNKNDFGLESQLQALLYDCPDLIRKESAEPIVFTREACLPGSGYTDLIGVDTSGNVVLVETKLAKNLEARRKVIGQIIEYAAYLWGTSYEFLDQIFQQREEKNIFDLLSAKAPDLEFESFQRAVSDTLRVGKFELVIVVDEMNEELEKIIAYLSSRGAGLKVEAVALQIYQADGVEVVAPQRYGQLTQPDLATPAPGRLNVATIIESSPDEHTRKLMELVTSDWSNYSFQIEPGTKGLSCKSLIAGKSQPIFWADPVWGLQPLFDMSLKRGAPPEAVQAYRMACAKIAGFDADKCSTMARPTVTFRQLDEKAVREFVSVAGAFAKTWQAAVVNGSAADTSIRDAASV